jgi:hypothetical protein
VDRISVSVGRIRAPQSKSELSPAKSGPRGANQSFESGRSWVPAGRIRAPRSRLGPCRPNQAPCGPNQGPRRPNQDPHGLSKGPCRSSCCDQSVLSYVLGASDPLPHDTHTHTADGVSENTYLSKWCKTTRSVYIYQTTVCFHTQVYFYVSDRDFTSQYVLKILCLPIME